MVQVQNMKLETIGNFTTLMGFMREYHGKGTRLSSYDFVRRKLSIAGIGNRIKYKGFYITRYKLIAGINRKRYGGYIEEDDDEFVL